MARGDIPCKITTVELHNDAVERFGGQHATIDPSRSKRLPPARFVEQKHCGLFEQKN
jgi:hypothetical protein